MTAQKTSWIDRIDRALDKGDRFLDRFRKAPRRRLEVVPHPPPSPDPFSPQTVDGPSTPLEKPLGDEGLPAQIYGRRTCDKSALTMNLFREASLVPRMIDLDDPDNREFEPRLIRETKRYDTPYVYVRGTYIGGFEEVAKLAKSGQLAKS
ncbi:MAG: hypothetical protein HOW73_16945 [Polyangiaceae bacterium]|nr:hypothetical protein [Polyangiaceae bacterium]